MPNTYRVRGTVGFIEIRNGEGALVATTKVDRDLLPILKERTWNLAGRDRAYVFANGHGGGKQNMYLHRFVAGTHGTKMWTDHKNGDKFDNRRSNLRAVSATKSQVNKRTKRGELRQIYKARNGKWVAGIHMTFDTIEEAQVWRDAVNTYVHGIDFMEECGLWAVKSIG